MLVELDRESQIPLYVQIEKQVRELILSGVIQEGDRLPPTRKLAESLGVNRSTVVNAYQNLWTEGLVEGRAGGGTVVKEAHISSNREKVACQPLLWKEHFTNWKPPSGYWIDKTSLNREKDIISFDYGAPPPDLFPVKEVRRILLDILKDTPDKIRYSSSQGSARLRESLSEKMKMMGIEASPSQILILSGSEQGIYLTVQGLLDKNSGVAVEVPTYPGILRTLQAYGAQIYAVPRDKQGLRLDILEGVLSYQRPKLIYIIPTFHNPTGNTIDLEQRKALLELAYRYRVPILEDDPYYDLRYTGHNIPPLKAFDRRNYVLYLSTFSKAGFPGLRVGWLVAPREVIDQFTSIKKSIDLCSSTLGQYVIYEMFKRKIDLLKWILPIYKSRRDATTAALEKNCTDLMDWQNPQGGFFIWAKLCNGLRAELLQDEALKNGVNFVPGSHFFPEGGGGDRNIRLSFSRLAEDRIEEGVRRLRFAIKSCFQRMRKEKPMDYEEEADRPLV